MNLLIIIGAVLALVGGCAFVIFKACSAPIKPPDDDDYLPRE